MFWSDEADEVIITDGADRGVGESLRFLEYLGHKAIEAEMGDLNFGLFDGPATTWLVLDRHAGNLYYASAETARAFIVQQHAANAVEDARLQLRDDAEALVETYDPELDKLRTYLHKFVGPSESE